MVIIYIEMSVYTFFSYTVVGYGCEMKIITLIQTEISSPPSHEYIIKIRCLLSDLAYVLAENAKGWKTCKATEREGTGDN